MKNSNSINELREIIKDKGRDNIDYKKFVEDNILKDNERLLYLTKVGSHLKGTSNNESDLDIKGVFVPSKKSLILRNKVDRYGPYSTGKDDDRNGKYDVDIELLSIHSFFNTLKKGDTNAVDILFSTTNEDTMIYNDGFEVIYDNRYKLLSSKSLRKSFIGYAYGQYKRYEAKGFNFVTLKTILKYFKENDYDPNDKLGEYSLELIAAMKRELMSKAKGRVELEMMVAEQLEIIEENNDMFLEINEYKKYPFGIRVKQFIDHIQKWTEIYGSRVKNNDDGIDYKSISHAYEVLFMAEEIANNKDFSFPLDKNKREKLVNIKNGKLDYKKLISKLETYVDKVGEKIENSKILNKKPSNSFSKKYILEVYGIK